MAMSVRTSNNAMGLQYISLHPYHWIYTFLLLQHINSVYGEYKYQSFRVEPVNSTVIEGDSITLGCEVNNQEGDVQWAFNGFVLGYNRDVPGYDRFSMTGDPFKGVHNLHIRDASVEDDGMYSCQVAPKGKSKAIMTAAYLTVLLPPKTIEIANFRNNSEVEVKQQETIQLSCVVGQSKPPAQIKWFRKNVELLKPDYVQDKLEEGDNGRQKTISIITISPNSDDNGLSYSCQAFHHSLRKPLVTSVRLSVLFPPGPPEIIGYTEGEILRAGNAVTLRCISRGGNPLANVLWYKDGDNKPLDSSYTRIGKESVNPLTFIANASDNNAIYRCVATNTVSPPMTAQVKLSVQFGPEKVTVASDRSSAKVGDIVTMSCRTEVSNPKAEIWWVVDGRPMNSTSSSRHHMEGWITSSELTVNITENDRNMKVFTCYAVNQALGETVVQTYTVDIIYPPSHPKIYGYNDSSPFKANEEYTLTCVTTGGNPLPEHRWFRYKNKQIQKVTVKSDNTTVRSEITFKALERDNEVPIRCEAVIKTGPPLKATIYPKVYFGPNNVTVDYQGPLKAGKRAVLTCRTSSSNPKPEVTWFKGHRQIIEGVREVSTKNASYGGLIVESKLVIDQLSEDDHEALYRCQATNPKLRISEHETVKLYVDHKPVFQTPVGERFQFVEGDSAVIHLKVKAHPEANKFVWRKEDNIKIPSLNPRSDIIPRVFHKGSSLNLTRVVRGDSGVYLVEASNAAGSSETSISIDVFYPAMVRSVDNVTYANEGEEVRINCQVDGHPITNDTISWHRENYDFTRTSQTLQGPRSSMLIIYNVTHNDNGTFWCEANNRIASEPHAAPAHLVINFAPRIDRNPAFQRAAANETGTARLLCRAYGAPTVSFSWRRNNVNIATGPSAQGPGRFQTFSRKLTVSYFEQELIISDIHSLDYGNYTCVAHNDLGSDSTQIELSTIGSPQPPLNLELHNATYNSIEVSWVPGFNGGLAQSFKLRYKPRGSRHGYTFKELINPQSYNLTVLGLDVDTEYEFSMMAYNELGESEYMPEVYGKTIDEIPASSGQTLLPASMSKVDIPKVIITSVSVVGTSLLLLNILLVVCFVRKRKTKRQKEQEESDHSTSKPAAIEMYAPPPSYNTETVAETVSSASEKSDTAHFSSDDSTAKPSFILDQTSGMTESNGIHYTHGTLPTFYHDDSSLVSAKPQAQTPVDRHATLPARHHHRVHYAPEIERRMSEAEYSYGPQGQVHATPSTGTSHPHSFKLNQNPPTPPGRTSASALITGTLPLRGDMYNVGYITYPHAELTSFNNSPLAANRISEHDGHLV